MAATNGQAKDSGIRMSALWGTGGKRGDGSRSSVLWGKGGRGARAALLVVVAVMVAPIAASAAPGTPPPPPPAPAPVAAPAGIFVTASLASAAAASPQQNFSVIVQGDGSKNAGNVAHQVANLAAQANTQLVGAAQKADAAVQQAQQAVTTATQALTKAQQDLASAQATVSTKAAAFGQAQSAAMTAQVAYIQAAMAAKLADAGTNKPAAQTADAAATKAQANAQHLIQLATQAQQNLVQAQSVASQKAAVVAQAQQALATAQAALAAAQSADTAANGQITQTASNILQQQITGQFSSISGVAATLAGNQITQLATHAPAGLVSITPNGTVQVVNPTSTSTPAPTPLPSPPVTTSTAFSSSQNWPFASESAENWSQDSDASFATGQPTIAIVDSGIQQRSDFGSRLIGSVDLSTIPGASSGDANGHGTFVAGIAAGSAGGITGADPAANLLDVQVMDANGEAQTSDVINACQWILAHKAQYNIRVANFSLQTSIVAPFYLDPLDRAIEQLWFNGITVVTAAGNYGSSSGATGVLFSPADDPFVITVGAADVSGSIDPSKAKMAPWSAWGSTIDGFAKPELSAPGRYMVGPVPTGSTLASEFPNDVTAPGYMELSGTSFAAPVVSGAAANIIAAHPSWTPDQVKGALMLTAAPMSPSVGQAGGVGLVQAADARNVSSPPNPNLALEQFVTSAAAGSADGVAFDSASWNSAASTSASWDSASWNSASWNSASWNSASWNSASWNSASWNSASWNSASWNSASWNSASWNSASWNSAHVGDATADMSAITVSPSDVAQLLADPGFDPTTLPAWLLPAKTATAHS